MSTLNDTQTNSIQNSNNNNDNSANSLIEIKPSGNQQQQQLPNNNNNLTNRSNSPASSSSTTTTTTTSSAKIPSSSQPKNVSQSHRRNKSATTTNSNKDEEAPITNSPTGSASSANLLPTTNPTNDNSSSINGDPTTTTNNNSMALVPVINNHFSGGNTNSNNSANNQVSTVNVNGGSVSGYLQKWTNYIKGYQRRWFVLNNGLLSYYRSQVEMSHTCRGTINLSNADINSEDSCLFVVSNGSSQTFHLKAANEAEKQKWVSALELAKSRTKPSKHHNNNNNHNSSSSHSQQHQQQDSDDEDGGIEAEKSELASMLRFLQLKLDELATSHQFVLKHSTLLTKSLTELENVQSKPDDNLIKTINERSTVYKITMLTVVNACQEFIKLAQLQTTKMHKVLESERLMRSKLEDMVQEMAKQQLNFETQLKRKQRSTNNQNINNSRQPKSIHSATSGVSTLLQASESFKSVNTIIDSESPHPNDNADSAFEQSSDVSSKPRQQKKTTSRHRKVTNSGQDNGTESYYSNVEDNDDDNMSSPNDGDEEEDQFGDEFHDAVEDVQQFSVTLPRQVDVGLHHRHPSNISKLYLQESDISSGDEDGDNKQKTIQVTMQSNKETIKSGTDSADQASSSSSSTKKQHKQIRTTHSSAALLTQSGKMKKMTPGDILAAKASLRPIRKRRTTINPRPNYSLNLWSFMKNCIGKDLSKIPLPVNFSEPLSMLQRVTEELEYSKLLDIASSCEDQWEQMALVAAFTVTSYSTTDKRTNKPFNPVLGETYECDRLDDLGWRYMSEQVSHHPPGFAAHVESVKDWVFNQEFTMSSKFRGQYLQIVPLGTSHLEFQKSGHHYTWRKVNTYVRNMIVGKLWVDHVGEMDIVNHKTKDVCHLKYFPYSYFSREPPRKVTGIITDSNNMARYVLNGTWSDKIEGAPVLNPQVVTEQTQLNTGASKVLWIRKYPP
jgi:hypothetical protein